MILKRDEFIAFDYVQSQKYLSKQSVAKADYSKILVIVVGANGSGKSTYIANLYAKGYVRYKYVNADIVAKTIFFSIQSESDRNYRAMKYTTDLVGTMITSGEAFVYESVFSHESKLKLVKFAKDNGYRVVAIYVETDNYDINIKRVAKRVSQGGHNVLEEKISSRWQRVCENVKQLQLVADEFYVFNNSKEIN